LNIPYRFRVSIPIEAIVQDGVDFSVSHKLEDGLTLGDILRVHVEGTITPHYICRYDYLSLRKNIHSQLCNI